MQAKSTPPLPAAADVVAEHDRLLALADWPASCPLSDAGDVWHWLRVNHANNSRLWAEEDLARRTQVDEREIAANKRAIDRFNQARNDATERLDELLLLALGLVDPVTSGSDDPQVRAAAGARLNSETAGSIVDRLSILSLKIRAMGEQVRRTDVDAGHRQASQGRLARLIIQRADLARCLDELLSDCSAGRAWFTIYRQFKMYNDPAFNPQLVKERGLG